MKSKQLKQSLIATITLGLCAVGFSQSSTPTVVAKVNGQPIYETDYLHEMEYLPNVGVMSGDQFIPYPPGLLTLNKMIGDELVLQLAAKKNVTPTTDEVQAALRDAISKNPGLQSAWIASGRTQQELDFRFKLQVAQFNLITAGVIVTDQEVQDQYKTHPELYTTPKLYELRVIVVDSTDAQAKVDADLKSGKSFSDVAKADSIDVTKIDGGYYGKVPGTALPKAVLDALGQTKIGDTTAWINVSNDPNSVALAKFEFENVVPAALLPLDPQLMHDIRHQMMIDRGVKINDIAASMNSMKKTADIQITNPDFAKQFEQLRQRNGALPGTGSSTPSK